MSNVFLFTARIPNESTSRIAVSDGSAPKQMQASGSPFALTPADWRNLSQLVKAVSVQREQAQGLISPEPCASAMLQRTWLMLAEQCSNWTITLMPTMRALAADIVSYAHDVVPARYGPLKATLDAAGARALTADEAQQCKANLARAADEANTRATRAAATAQPIGSFVSAVTDFRTAYNDLPRNPPVNVVLPDIPYICLSYGGDGLACASDLRSDPAPKWVVEFNRSSPDLFTLTSAGDSHRMLRVPPAPWPKGFPFVPNEGPRPGTAMVSGIQPGQTGDAELLFRLQDSVLQNIQYEFHCMDCAGNDGWQTGTPILTFRRNGGNNQKWGFSPPPRPPREVGFHDCMSVAATYAQLVGGVEHLRGDWLALSDDLHAGIADLLRSVDLKEPFIASLQVQQVMDEWASLATEAQAAAAGLGS